MEQRLRKLKTKMKRKGLDALLVTDLRNVRYLSGFTGSSAALFVGRRVHFFTDFRYQEQSRKEVSAKAMIHITTKGVAAELASLPELKQIAKIGYEGVHLTCSLLENLKKKLSKAGKFKWVSTANMVEDMRVVKEAEEIALIARAASITDKVFAEILPLIKPGVAEMDLSAEIIYRFMRYTGLPPAFSTIVASGPNSAMPHARPTKRKLRKGDFLTFDMGCQWKGYASDFTRTVVIGKATKKHTEIYNIVLQAHQLAIKGIRAGITTRAADSLARDHIAEQGYGKYFGHSLGHGVGLNVHEAPRLAALGNGKIKSGSVVTVEPGIYLPGWGGVRIEDLVVVTAQGVKILSKSPRNKLVEL